MPERHALQVTIQVVGPVVVNTSEVRFAATAINAQGRTAMRTPIDEHFHGLGVTDHDDWRITDVVRLEITRIGCLGLQTNPVPGITTENPLLFEVVQGLIHKHLIGHPADAHWWPVYEWLLDGGTWDAWHSGLLTRE